METSQTSLPSLEKALGDAQKKREKEEAVVASIFEELKGK